MTIYIDSYFFLNMTMDWLMLITVCRIFNYPPNILRIGVAAAIGGIYACIVLIFSDKNSIIEGLYTYAIVSTILCMVAFGFKSWKNTMQLVGTLYMVTFCFSGFINTLYLRKIIKSTKVLIIVSFFGIIIINRMIKLFRARINYNTSITKVKIVNRNNVVVVNALTDTGNSLKEPITGKPVSVISKEKAVIILEGVEKKSFLIPYSSVGKEHGLLNGFMVDYMEIGEGKDKLVVIKPILAEYQGEFSSSKEYEMLLNPLIKEGSQGCQ